MTMLLDDFKPVALGDKAAFDSILKRYPRGSSEYLFTTLLSWGHYMPAYSTVREGSLVIMTMKDGRPQFRPPIGEMNEPLLREVLDVAKKEGSERPLVGAEEEARGWIGKLYPAMELVPDRDAFDYVYLADDLAKLAGQGYRIQRGNVNRFKRTYKYSVEEVPQDDTREVEDFLKRWCMEHGCDTNPLLEAEVTAMKYCMGHFRQLGLSGMALRVDGAIQALSVWEPMAADTAAIHFEKAMQGFEGIYSAINNEAAKLLEGSFRFINRESDLGIQGLRTAKERLHPHHMVEVYYADRKSLIDKD